MQKKDLRVIGCGIMKEELTHAPSDGVSFIFLEQSLHRTPQKMKETIQEEINKADMREGNSIILSYGLCSNGIVESRRATNPLLFPRSTIVLPCFWALMSGISKNIKRNPEPII